MFSLNDTHSSFDSQPVPYSTVHATFVRLVCIAGKRHDNQPWLVRLVDALAPLDDTVKYARLCQIERDMEASRE